MDSAGRLTTLWMLYGRVRDDMLSLHPPWPYLPGLPLPPTLPTRTRRPWTLHMRRAVEKATRRMGVL